MTLSHSNTEANSIHRVEEECVSLLLRGAAELDIALTDTMRCQLFKHISLLARWNQRLNLTAISDPAEMVVQHILDCLAVSPLVRGNRILDIGSGGGFPGIPLAVLYPRREFVLLDSRGKRVEFLRHLIGKIGLTNTAVVKFRVEDYQPKEKFDTLVTRAFSSLEETLSRTQALQNPTSRLLAMKGRYPVKEISSLSDLVQRRLKVESINVPFLDAERNVVVIRF
ncbi:MAG: 16S rRNA (guanine(527)-N(7))-methyltransferase RsmG [bacterium]